ncbi:hypothetical protein E4S40_02775 [Algoriphagus kandeliae]|uniref:Uncharacterized protein n=1 Tax=Algoriphagus kandeliae TaxID=2562278 RepID=A0A4Y9QYK3_9BACT|nr:hypothetical protein [Algoriphagus kandeliae]TFV97591.1 hypothetical protein E4S40_02775 [Algoriphagus kandeliae]
MEKDSLNSLKLFLQEDLYLFGEEVDQILDKQNTKEISTEILKKEEVETEDSIDELELEDTRIQEVSEPVPPIIRGGFEKGILILHEEEALNDEIMDMLSKIIIAVNQSMNDVGLLSSKELEGKSLEDFQAINAHKVIKFGRISHPINALPIHDYQIKTEGETEYLFADSLTQISMDKALKRKLWDTLRTLFNIS